MEKTQSTKPGQADKREPICVAADDKDMRLDRWFKRYFPALTHGQIQKYLRKGQIRIDGKRADASDRLQAGQLIRVPPLLYVTDAYGAPNKGSVVAKRAEKINHAQTEKLQKMVIYQDDDVIVLNKPSGLAVQGGTGLKENLDDALMAFCKDGKTKPKLVHRLDRDTSGVLLIARTDFAARQLTAAFRDHATQKIYWAVTMGVPKARQGRISAPLIKRGEIMHVCEEKDEDAKSAVTLYQVMESVTGQAAFVALWPITGRTHQLRVHLAHLGTPILGDRLYSGGVATVLPLAELGKGLHLHARRIIVPHPRRGTIDVTAPLGLEMKKTWRWFNFDTQAEADFDDI